MEAAFSELLELRQSLEQQERRANELRQQIQQRMADATKAVFATGSVTWKRSTDTSRLDSDRLARERPEIYRAYCVPKPGARRFVINDQPRA